MHHPHYTKIVLEAALPYCFSSYISNYNFHLHRNIRILSYRMIFDTWMILFSYKFLGKNFSMGLKIKNKHKLIVSGMFDTRCTQGSFVRLFLRGLFWLIGCAIWAFVMMYLLRINDEAS